MPFWWRVLHGLADGDEQLQPLPGCEVVLVAVLGDRDALDQFHHEVRPRRAERRKSPGFGRFQNPATDVARLASRAAVKDLGDIGMIHQGEGLALGLEAGDDLFRVHAGLDELDCDQSLDRLGLLGHPDRAHAAFADLF